MGNLGIRKGATVEVAEERTKLAMITDLNVEVDKTAAPIATAAALLDVDLIRIGKRLRTDLGDLTALAESIRTVGLINPVVVDLEYNLIAGHRRLAACRDILKWPRIPVIIRVSRGALANELAEIDENIIRNELTTLERGEHLRRRKAIYEELHPEAKAGALRAAGMNRTLGHNVGEIISPTSEEHNVGEINPPTSDPIPSFAADTAAKTGVSPRTVQQEVQIAQKIAPEVKEQIRSTPLAASKNSLLALARLAPEEQEKAAAEMLANKKVAPKPAPKPQKKTTKTVVCPHCGETFEVPA